MKHKIKLLIFLLASAIIFPFFSSGQRTFVHPGIWHKQSDLDRMKYMVQSGLDPWKSSFKNLKNDPKADYDYEVRGDSTWTSLSRENPCEHCNEYESDARAAYLNTLMWSITGDKRHAKKAIEILNIWSYLTNFHGGGTEPLSAGIYASPLINAAEIIKHSNAGWADADVSRFKSMLVYPGYSTKEVPFDDIKNDNVTFYWRIFNGDPARHGNQDLAAQKAMMAMGIFLDNDTMYDRASRYFKGEPHRPDDFAYAAGPPENTFKKAEEFFEEYNYKMPAKPAIPYDYGYDGVLANYLWDNGQCEETSRDQAHAQLGIGFCAEMAEMAWNQGEDIYGLANNRILKGSEYTLKYNVSFRNSYPDQKKSWEPLPPFEFYQQSDRTGRWKSIKASTIARGTYQLHPLWEMILAHYIQRVGMREDSALWTTRARDEAIKEVGPEGSGYKLDCSGWGGLTFRRAPFCAGDPCSFNNGKVSFAMNVLPGKIEAENFDYYPGNGEGKSYHDLTTGNSKKQYRIKENVDIETCSEGGYNLTDLEAGEWLSYTVYIPKKDKYNIAVRYASTGKAGGKINVSFIGVDKTGEVEIPSDKISDNNWKDFIAGKNILLEQGVQNMRIKISGTGKAFKLNSISIYK